MSLQVWLPLTKDLRNQGLLDAVVTNNGATFNSAGKLGGCYYFNGSAYFSGDSLSANMKSATFWVKLSNLNNSLIFVDYKSHLAFGIYSTYLICSCVEPAGFRTCYNKNILTTDKWIHVAVIKTDSIYALYINGVLQTPISTLDHWTTNITDKFTIGARSNGSTCMTGYINDFRLYDHVLSLMEIKQISQGLVLHYPLDRNGWGNENILTNTHFDATYSQTTGWNTTKNGTLLASSWGGYNSGVTNASTVYHAHLKLFEGEYVYEYIKTADESWLGISQGFSYSTLTAGETYTFSWEEYHVSGVNRVGTGLYYYKTGATSANFHLGIQQASNVTRVTGKWQKFSYTFTAPSDADSSKNFSWYIYGHYNGNGTFYMRHPKLEKGSIATPWCPKTTDTLAATLGLNGTTEYDCSGFCNNGTRTGTFTWTSDTSKYNVSTVFPANTSTYLTNTSVFSSVQTVSFWLKFLEVPNGGVKVFSDIGSKLCFINSGNSTNSQYAFNFYLQTYTGTSTDKTNDLRLLTSDFDITIWHFFTIIILDDGTLKFYIDGIEHATSGKSGQSDLGTGLVIGKSNKSFEINDFRMYATALSAANVKSLYQNSAYIDSFGNVYGAIHSEA